MTLEFISSKYRVLGKKGEGTFSEVLKCQNVKDGTYRACKKMKQHYESIEQVNNLREIQAMRRLSPHPNILELQEVLFDKKSGTLVLVCELMDMNIYELIRGRRHYVPEKKIKLYMYQLLRSIDHMHRNGIFHRDVKPENILIKEDLLKLADFGSCRSVYSKQPYTEYISTRWYRAPECLLTDGYYTYKMDIWSVGCVFFEIMSLHPLFPGSNEVDQIAKIHDIMGTPDISVLNKLRNKTRGMNFNFPTKKGSGIEKLLPHASHDCIDLIYQMCSYDPDERIAAKQAIRHPYFKELRESDKRAAALEKQRQQHLKEQQEREKEKEKKDKEESGEKEKEKTKKISDAKDSDQVSVIRSSRPPSGGSTVVARYPASILHGRDPIYSYHRKERRKRRQRQRMSESGPSPNGSSLLPKVNQAKPSTFQPTFHSTSYSGAATLPKLAGGTAASSNSTATMLPSLTNAFVKPAPKPKVSMYRMNGSSYPTFGTAKSSATTTLMPTFTNTFVKPAPKAKMGGVKGQRVYLEKYTHQAQPQATKNMYGHYQLPSIDRRGAGY